jgi:pSer/pThr/pTyr-binding forkhead associated (FHA) protein
MQIFWLVIIIADVIFGAVFIGKVIKFSKINNQTHNNYNTNNYVAENKPVQQPTAPQYVQPTAPRPVTPQPAIPKNISGVSGQYGGKTIPINGKMVLGRNPKAANLIFDAKSPGVSSIHCEIKKTADGLYLTDIGSSNGTFLNGNRIPNGVPQKLKSGDNFFLGSPNNAFTVIS